MSKAEGLFFNKHTPDCSKELMGCSKDCLFKGKPFCLSFHKVFLEVSIMQNYTNCHEPGNPSEVPVSSFRDLTFTFKPARFIHCGVKPAVSYELFWGTKPFYITHFSQETHGCNVSDSFYGFKDFYILAEGGFFTEFSEHIGEELKLFFEEEEFFDFLEEDYFSYRPVMGDRVFGEGFDFLSRDTEGSTRPLGRDGGFKFFEGCGSDGMSGGEGGEELKDRGVEDIDLFFELWEEDGEVFFDIIFDMGDSLGNSLSFSGYGAEFMGKEGIFR